MISLPDNVRQDLVTLLPASLVNEVICFVFYDNHPRDQKNIDITVCTSRGEIKEFYKRDLINSTIINSIWKPQNIRILRNSKCQLFYLVSYEDEIALVSSTNKLQVLHKINNISTYEVDDSICRGKASLKIICKDDAVPLYFDDNFEKLADRSEVFSDENKAVSLPIITQLARKLTEVKYSVKCNEKVLKDLSNLRQIAAYSDYKKCSPTEGGATFLEQKVESRGPLIIKSLTPVVKISNKKVTIILEIINKSTLLADNINILLHSSQASTVYTTKVFETIQNPPYWKEKLSNTILPSSEYSEYNAIVAVIDLKELKYRVTSKINLRSVVTYKIDSKEYLLPIKDIHLSSLDTMGENYDVLLTFQDGNKYNVIAYLATSDKTDLCLRHIKAENDKDLKLLDMFCEHLNMQRMANMSNIVIHKSSPYHTLYGVMVVVEKAVIGDDKWILSLHTRSWDQILEFIHYIHDSIPYRIVATTTNHIITSKIHELTKYDEVTNESSTNMNYSSFKLSLMKQTSMTLEYLDECMIKMNENKNPVVKSKVGSEIDIFAGGVSRFQEFRNKLLEEVATGISSICEETCSEETEGMVIDID